MSFHEAKNLSDQAGSYFMNFENISTKFKRFKWSWKWFWQDWYFFEFELKVTFFRTWPHPSTSLLAFWPFQLPNVNQFSYYFFLQKNTSYSTSNQTGIKHFDIRIGGWILQKVLVDFKLKGSAITCKNLKYLLSQQQLKTIR